MSKDFASFQVDDAVKALNEKLVLDDNNLQTFRARNNRDAETVFETGQDVARVESCNRIREEHFCRAWEARREEMLLKSSESTCHTENSQSVANGIQSRSFPSKCEQSKQSNSSTPSPANIEIVAPSTTGSVDDVRSPQFVMHLHANGFTLEPVSRKVSSRIWRRFGSDRFLYIKVDKYGRGKAKQDTACMLREWVSDGIQVLGRRYRFLTKSDNDEGVIMFAEYSIDTEPALRKLEHNITVEQVLKWQVPHDSNPNLSLRKLHARLKLAFTPTRPVTLDETVQILTKPDIPALDGAGIMTDGCGLISTELLATVLKQSRLPNSWDAGDIPAVIQCRLGPFKGLLLADHKTKNTITFRKSMQKFQLPEPDLWQQQLEIRAIGKTGRGALNKQVLVLLAAVGVSTNTFIELANEWYDTQKLVLQSDKQALRDFCDSIKLALRQTTALPTALSSQKQLMCDMYEAGLESDYRFKAFVRSVILKEVNAMPETLKLPVAKSCRMFIVPDPTGLLASDEAYVSSSDPRIGSLAGKNIVITRNPCHHPGDIVKLRVRALPSGWEYLTDVCVLPTRGVRSVGSRMAGGDYDGDVSWICWDDRIVDSVTTHKAASYHSAANEMENGTEAITSKRIGLHKLRTLVSNHPSNNHQIGPLAFASIKEYLQTSNLVCLGNKHTKQQPANLGYVTNLHLRWADLRGALSQECLHLAKLCSQAVDSPKTGVEVFVPRHLSKLSTYPHWWGAIPHGKEVYTSNSCIGQLHDFAKTRSNGFFSSHTASSTTSDDMFTRVPAPLARAMEQYAGHSKFQNAAENATRNYNRELSMLITLARPVSEFTALVSAHEDVFECICDQVSDEDWKRTRIEVALAYYKAAYVGTPTPRTLPWTLKNCTEELLDVARLYVDP